MNDLDINSISVGRAAELRNGHRVNGRHSHDALGHGRPAGIDQPRVERAVRELLAALGEDPDREGLRDTPRRVARAYREFFAGIADDAGRHLAKTFAQASEQLVLVSGIEFSSMCEHHLLPFFGRASIAYLPANNRVVGLSKLARTVEVFARRPQIQEQMTAQIADALEAHLQPRGVCVLVEAEHLCMKLRGANQSAAVTTTLATRGVYLRDAAARAEALSLMKVRP